MFGVSVRGIQVDLSIHNNKICEEKAYSNALRMTYSAFDFKILRKTRTSINLSTKKEGVFFSPFFQNLLTAKLLIVNYFELT